MWIKDFNERLVNIDNWDFLDAHTIIDNERGESILWKVFLSRNKEEYTLGYIRYKDNEFQDILARISKGIQMWFDSLNSALYYYLDENNEFDEFDSIIQTQDWQTEYDKKIKKVEELIRTRFIED